MGQGWGGEVLERETVHEKSSSSTSSLMLNIVSFFFFILAFLVRGNIIFFEPLEIYLSIHSVLLLSPHSRLSIKENRGE